tara:strand:- start:823 stop:981 length:159 start_codon:yes stop_codon:yes gene_type:complete
MRVRKGSDQAVGICVPSVANLRQPLNSPISYLLIKIELSGDFSYPGIPELSG